MIDELFFFFFFLNAPILCTFTCVLLLTRYQRRFISLNSHDHNAIGEKEGMDCSGRGVARPHSSTLWVVFW